MLLLPIKDTSFVTGFLEKGELWEIEKDVGFESDIREGRAQAFEVRGEKDKVIATGKRQ